MELVTGPPVIQVGFEISLPHDLFASLILVQSSQRVEGLSDWVAQAGSRLSGDLRAELDAVMGLFNYCSELWGRLTVQLSPQHPARTDFAAWISELEARPAQAYRELALAGLARNLDKRRAGGDLVGAPSPSDIREAVAALDKIFQETRPGWSQRRPDSGLVVSLLQDGKGIKDRLIRLLRAFWDQAYRARFERDLVKMRRCVAYHQRQDYPAGFRAKFSAITGRTPPQVDFDYLEGIRRVIFVPSCHIGPYFVLAHTPPTLQISFNCRTAAQSEVDQAPVIRLFPPLKALADETRLQILALLQGRELYAQQIIQELDISQSAASRHLQLLEKTGVLDVRKANNMKYYSINPSKGAEILNGLGRLLAES